MICFLDRDGIINIDYGYVGSIDRFAWNPGIFSLLSLLKSKGYSFVLVTNQSGIGRGYYSFSDFFGLSFYIINYLSFHYDIDLEVNFCPHTPLDNCKCRKPSPAMLLRYNIGNMDIMIGDNPSDMESAFLAGVPHRWLVSSRPSGQYTATFPSICDLYDSDFLASFV